MSGELHPPLGIPKNGHTYEILAVRRVSDPKPGKQDEKSLEDQATSDNEWLARNVQQPYRITAISGSGSGELLDRAEYQRLIEEVATDQYDLVLTEDLGRIIRRVHAHLICEHCEDHNTRLYAKNDHVDTALPGWREASIFAAFHHERSNRDTSERIKRTHRNRFMIGACLRHAIYGWVKPPGAKSDAEMSKDPAAEAIYKEWFRMLDEGNASFADVASYLNENGVPVTKWKNASSRWDGKMVARHTFNKLLKGVRERNNRRSRRINTTGKYVSVKAAPEDLLSRKVPHLAFFEEAYFDEVIAKVRARNARFRRSDDPAADPCLNRPRKKTRYPGRAAFCGICGRQFVWGGHGMTDHLMCTGAREHRCWNGATFDGPTAARRIAAAVMEEVNKLEDFDLAFLQLLNEENLQLDQAREQKMTVLQRRLAETEAAIGNIVAFLKAGTAAASLAQELQHLEEQKLRLGAEIRGVQLRSCQMVQIPPAAQIRSLVTDCLKDLDLTSQEFAQAMRKLVPLIAVFPVQLCDGGPVVLRARFNLHLASLLADRGAAAMLNRPLERVVTIDLFDVPQREQFRKQVLAARKAGKSEREAAAQCGITVTAAQRAAALQRKMDEMGISDPYVLVLQPADDCDKLRRHRHPDYRFEPLPRTW